MHESYVPYAVNKSIYNEKKKRLSTIKSLNLV